jgi:ubiquinone/menaquinone biosynthesis C-methylase UbiE
VGAVLHSAVFYDLTVYLALWGRERTFREQLLELARLRSGESVLDVGCGTGSLAILAKKRVGSTASVCGVDASPEMIARARFKARRAHAEVRFEVAAAQALPYPQAQFDVALSTIMLHHLGRSGRRDLAREVRRVVKPGGRVLLVDFAVATRRRRGHLAWFRHGHGHIEPSELSSVLGDCGFELVEAGAVGIKDLHFALARAPLGA